MGRVQPCVQFGTDQIQLGTDGLVDTSPPTSEEANLAKRYMFADLTDYGQVIGCLSDVDSIHKGIDAVIHLAAIPAPGKSVCGLCPHLSFLGAQMPRTSSRRR